MAGVQIDGVNNKIDFDDDLDTSISANTDDTLVIEVGGNTLATVTATEVAINDGTTITVADNTDNLTLVTTDTDANAGPNLDLYRNAGNGTDGDLIGNVVWSANDAAGNKTDFVNQRVYITTAADGSEESTFQFLNMTAGTARSLLEIGGGEVAFNEDSQDIDFRVESNGNANMLFVDGGNNIVGIGASPDLGTGLHVKTADSGATVNAAADELVIEASGNGGMTILNGTSSAGAIHFGDSGNNAIGYIAYQHNNNHMVFGVNNTEVVNIHDNGVAAFNNGIALGVGTANTASNVLDDYEEGTWTIILEDQSDNAVTLNTNSGTYIKIGGQVTITGFLTATSLGSASSALRISGLPFNILGNSRNYAAMTIGYAQGLAITAGTSIAGIGIINSNNVNIVNFDVAAGSSNLVASKFSADGGFVFTMTYTVV